MVADAAATAAVLDGGVSALAAKVRCGWVASRSGEACLGTEQAGEAAWEVAEACGAMLAKHVLSRWLAC